MTRQKRSRRARHRSLLQRILDLLGSLDQRVSALEGATHPGIENRLAAVEEVLKPYLAR